MAGDVFRQFLYFLVWNKNNRQTQEYLKMEHNFEIFKQKYDFYSELR